MRLLFLFLVVATGCYAQSPALPKGVRMDTVPCSYATGLTSHYFYANNEMIGMIEPSDCNYSQTQGGRVNPICFAELYNAGRRDTFSSKKEAYAWIVAEMEAYYKPVTVTKWQKLRVQPPKVSLSYPWDWTYKLGKLDGMFKSKSLSENKLILMIKDQRGQSEVFQIIRTPNTAKLTTQQVMEMTASMNRAVDLKSKAPGTRVIGGKTFRTSENAFMQLMQQQHFWYADDQEIIYIMVGLLKDERLRYPGVVNEIVNSIAW
jgi:hypothetical protein